LALACYRRVDADLAAAAANDTVSAQGVPEPCSSEADEL
jgi:hypothetical protein